MALTKITPQMFDTSATAHDLNVDNGTFVVDGSASRVGIGTSTPSTLLDVNGVLTATSIAGTLTTAAQTNITSVGTLSSLTVSGALNGTLSTAAQTNITSVGTLSSLTVSGALNGTLSTAAQTNITSVGTLTGLNLSGNVFSGNKTGLTDTNTGHAIAPGGLVYHTTDGTITQSLNRLTDDGPVLRLVGNGTTAGSVGVLSGGLSFGSGSSMTTRMVIDSSGKVGIATASPSTVLDVNGVLGVGNARVHETRINQTLALTTAAQRGGMSINSWYNSAAGPIIDFNISRNNTAGSHTVVQTNDALGTLIFRGDDGDEFVDSVAIEANVDAAPGNDDMPGRLVFYTSPDGTTGLQERMRIDNQGRVGINVTPDTALLEIVRTNNDTYTPTAFLENQQIRIKHPNATNNYGGIGFSNSAGNYEWFAGAVQTGSSTADFIIQGADSTSTYSEVFRINSQGTVTVPGNLTAQNVINIGTDSSIQTTSARQWATIKNTGTSSSDYSEMKISNNNDDYLIMGSIGSNYTHIDWTGSSYIYANRELRIKSSQGVRFFVGGMNMNSHDRMYLDTNGHLTLSGNASGGSAYITKSADGAGDQEILRIGRIGGATSNGERRASISFYDAANATYTAKISGYRESPSGNYNGGLKFYVNPHSVNSSATFAELDNTPAMYLRADRGMEMVAGHIIMPSGYGINFGATPAPSNSASASSTVLDDYEEGLWTPTLPNGGSVTNYRSTYVKIGRFVYLYCYIYISPSNDTNQLQIGGMPYIAFNASNYHTNGTIGYSSTINTASYRPLAYYNRSYMYFHRTNGSGATLTNNGIYVGGGPLLMNISYETNT